MQFTLARIATVLGALAVSAFVCGSWWLNAKPAIDAMQATLYPGQRTTMAGGDMKLFMSFRGFLNAHTLYFNDGVLNASEASSFLYFFPVVAAAWILAVLRKRSRLDAVDVALLLFCVVALWFQLVGFGPQVGELSLWGRVVPVRVDLSLGLASVLWCGLWLGRFSNGSALLVPAWVALATALGWGRCGHGVVHAFARSSGRSAAELVVDRAAIWRARVVLDAARRSCERISWRD